MEQHIIKQFVYLGLIFVVMYFAFRLMKKVKDKPSDEEIQQMRHDIAQHEAEILEEELKENLEEQETNEE
jgi:Amino acid transporters